MQRIGSFLSLFRWHNLIMVALTQYLFRYCIIWPVFRHNDLEMPLSSFHFFLLVLATVLISAAGYAINDYFDIRIDRINRPSRVIVGRLISRRTAILTHWILTTVGVLLGVYLSWHIRYWPLALIFLATPMLLWLYSMRFKKNFLTGNITVAVLSGLVVALVWLVEYRAALMQIAVPPDVMRINFFVQFYAFFAFIMNLGREIAKDMEDFAGDAKTGCRSLPIVLGPDKTRKIILAIMFVVVIGMLLYFVRLGMAGRFALLSYFAFFVLIPIVAVMLYIRKAFDPFDFKVIQTALKFIMLAGVLSMVVQYFFINL